MLVPFNGPLWHCPFHLFKVNVATGWKVTDKQQWSSLCFRCDFNNKEKNVGENVENGEIQQSTAGALTLQIRMSRLALPVQETFKITYCVVWVWHSFQPLLRCLKEIEGEMEYYVILVDSSGHIWVLTIKGMCFQVVQTTSLCGFCKEILTGLSRVHWLQGETATTVFYYSL